MWSAPILNSMRASAVRKTVAQRQIFTRSEKAEIYPEYLEDPAGFSKDILGIELWEVQVEIACSVRDNPKTAVAACYSSGKTLLAAVLTLWWLFTRTPAMVVSTAPTDKQVKELLWYEVDRLHANARRRLGGKINSKRARIDKERRGLGFVGNKENTSSGVHVTKNALFIEDEAAGISPKVSSGFSGVTSSPNSRHLRIGNPICDEGPFWDCFNNPIVAALWKTFHISALDTPNVVAGKQMVPGLCTREWVEEQRAEFGEKHPNWFRKVLGKFWFALDGSKVVTAELVEAGKQRWLSDEFLGSTDTCDVLSVDVAVGGDDDTVLYKLCSRIAMKVDNWHPPPGANAKWQAEKIIEWAERLQPRRLVIDFSGPGRGVGERVQEFQDAGRIPEVEICLVNQGEKAYQSTHYERLSDELAFAARRALESDNPKCVAIDPTDEQLAKELTWRGYRVDARSQKLSVDSKRTIRDKYGDSPDSAEAFALLFFKTKQEVEEQANQTKVLVF
jgi:phage terminase large subunit